MVLVKYHNIYSITFSIEYFSGMIILFVNEIYLQTAEVMIYPIS